MFDENPYMSISLGMITEFAELVGLLCHFRQEMGHREALDHRKFIEWLLSIA
jgi:hypothetical protein